VRASGETPGNVAFAGVRVSLTLLALHLHAPTLQVGMLLSFVLGLVGVGRAVRPRSRGRRG
jgi:hypothetical protein